MPGACHNGVELAVSTAQRRLDKRVIGALRRQQFIDHFIKFILPTVPAIAIAYRRACHM